MKESIIQKAIMDYLRLKGCLVFKVNNGGVYIKSIDRYMRSPMKGISDIVGLTPGGTFIAIEVKSPNKKPSIEQLDFIDKVRKKNGIAFWVSSLDEMIGVWEGKFLKF